MPPRRNLPSVDKLLTEIDRKLKNFGETYRDLPLREKVRLLVEISRDAKDLNISTLAQHGFSPSGARERLRLYFLEHVGEVIEREELTIVAGIDEGKRRIRELRIEHGYKILTGASPDEFTGLNLEPDQYILIDGEPDLEAAERWNTVDSIRKKKNLGARGRLLEFLMEYVGQVVTTEELHKVAGIKESARRVRELRTEEGYSISTRYTGRPELKGGEYVLESKERIAEPHDRRIEDEVKKEVYERDENKCQNPDCGWTRDKLTLEDPRYLELHHLRMHSRGGANTAENLVVLCSKCHDEVHAERLDGFVLD